MGGNGYHWQQHVDAADVDGLLEGAAHIVAAAGKNICALAVEHQDKLQSVGTKYLGGVTYQRNKAIGDLRERIVSRFVAVGGVDFGDAAHFYHDEIGGAVALLAAVDGGNERTHIVEPGCRVGAIGSVAVHDGAHEQGGLSAAPFQAHARAVHQNVAP